MSQKGSIQPLQKDKKPTKIHFFAAVNWWGKSEIRAYVKNIPKKRGEGL